MNDAKTKNELILTGVKEGDDQQFLGDLCNKMNVSSTTYDQVRIGRKNDERSRLLKLTFPTNFDARKFMAKFDQLRSEKAELPNIRMRLGKTKQERDAYAKSKIAAKKLNNESAASACATMALSGNM
jgi:ankyrin repeat protein